MNDRDAWVMFAAGALASNDACGTAAEAADTMLAEVHKRFGDTAPAPRVTSDAPTAPGRVSTPAGGQEGSRRQQGRAITKTEGSEP